MAIVKIAGLDPSLTHFGMVKGNLDLDTNLFEITELKLQKTEPSKIKSQRKNCDDIDRIRLLYTSMHDFIKDVDVVVAELPVGSQSARSMVSYAVSLSMLATVSTVFVPVTPIEVKMATVGSKTATKKEMIEWATTKYPNANWLTQKRLGVIELINDNEHLADATATIEAFKQTNEYKQFKLFRN
jgi:DNA repair ATPase RecN